MFLISLVYTLSFVTLPVAFLFNIPELQKWSLIIILGTSYFRLGLEIYKDYLVYNLLKETMIPKDKE